MGLANYRWFTHFKDGYVQHLNWFKYDHRPLLLRTGRTTEKRPPKRFCFIAAWTTDESFKDMIKENWGNDPSCPVAISSLTEKIQVWNMDVFGNINRRKRDLISRLSGIDRANPDGANSYLNHLQEVRWNDYEKTLLQEEVLWCQRVRHKWLQFGDKNTKFFHASTLIRRKRNKVEALKDDSGRWISDKEELKSMVSNFFRRLYSKDDQLCQEPYPLRGLFSKLDFEFTKSLEAEITSEEIKDVFFSMGALKAPNPYGFHALFFQSQ